MPAATPTPPARAAALVCLLEALGLLITAAVLAAELLGEKAGDAPTAGLSLVLSLLFGALLLLLAQRWHRGERWPRTPTVVWNLLLLPAAWTIGTTGTPFVGLALAVVAVAGILSAWAAPPPDLPEDRAL